MSKLTRRSLAVYAADQLINGVNAPTVAKHLVASLVESSKVSEYGLLLDDIAWELERRGELAVANVTSVHPLSMKLKKELEQQIKTATKTKSVLLREKIDKSLLGGVRIETAGRAWDHSISAKLAKLKETF